MVAARIPAITTPANSGRKKEVDICTKMLSAEDFVSRAVGNIALPIMPIITAANSEIAHQTEATLLESLSSEAFLMPMNFKSTCGMPK